MGIKLQGDNISSLRWGEKEHFSSRLGFKAVLLYIMIGVAFDFVVVEATHIPGVRNTFCDGLSRGLSAGDLGVHANETLSLKEDGVMDFMRACDPTSEVSSMEEFLELWNKGRDGIRWLRGAAEGGEAGKKKARDWM